MLYEIDKQHERLFREAAESEAKRKSESDTSSDPVLPGGWLPMRTAPINEHIILHVPNRYFLMLREIGLGYWDGATWLLLSDIGGEWSGSPVSPDAWQPLPEFKL